MEYGTARGTCVEGGEGGEEECGTDAGMKEWGWRDVLPDFRVNFFQVDEYSHETDESDDESEEEVAFSIAATTNPFDDDSLVENVDYKICQVLHLAFTPLTRLEL